ncbi:MAG TPA: phenylalanine--tRNA ligase subunit beta [Clostridiales bacterium]|nr:phenylalanine--tRNA ligase subunit beta [Clostridiales bacterium]
MLLPINWVKKYVEVDMSSKELADKLTMTGSNAEEVITLREGISNVVVGKILSVEPHSNADKLLVCKVDVGTETIQVVTGAGNVAAGQLVPVALHGSKLPGGITIKRGKLRGVESQGMLCSGEELELKDSDYPGAETDGILILQEYYPPGMDIKEALDLGGEVIDFEITSNRPDCLSVVGMAREIAAATGKSWSMPEIVLSPGVGSIENELQVEVENPDLCPRYLARVVKDIKIQPSPRWMRRHLAAAGVRPINNIVDITNYVMLELGQPMHAFDLDRVEGRKIIVRNARPGETLVTLDDKQRNLTPDMLVIADTGRPIALAGIMGGANSEITGETKQIVFESALFDGASVRMTSKKLGLRSESSSRFEKGLDINMALTAVDRAAQLVQELGAGTLVEGRLDVLGASTEKRKLTIQWEQINKLLALNLTAEQISGILTALGLEISVDGEYMTAIIPTYRNDIEGMADLAEEVARIYGYDRIPLTLMEGSASKGARTRKQKLIFSIKTALTGMGMHEAITYSFTSPHIYQKIGIGAADYPPVVRIANPLGEDQSIMRTTMLPSMLEVLSHNYNRRIENCSIFEINPIFIPKALPLTDLPDEMLTLAMGEYGENVDFYTLKGKVEVLASLLGLEDKLTFQPARHPALHPGRTAELLMDGKAIGLIGQIHPKTAENYETDAGTVLGELNLQAMLDQANTDRQYQALPRYPAVTRDLAFIVEKNVQAAEIAELIKKGGGSILEKVTLFDIYEGSQIPEGHKSMAYSLSYRADDRTLKDEEVNKAHQRIIDLLEKELGAKLR